MRYFSKILAAVAITLMIICAGKTFAASTDEMNAEAVELLNRLRQSRGLQPLEWNPTSKLQEAAQVRATEIVENFSHTRPNGSSCFTILKQYGLNYGYCGENMAYGTHLSPAGAMELWTNSPGHYKNMVNPNYREIGLACYEYGDNIYWVQIFFTRQ